MAEPVASFRLNPRVRFRAVGDEGVVVQIENSEVIVVNNVGLRILDLIREGGNTIAGIVASLQDDYQVTPDQLQQDVTRYVVDLRKHNVLQSWSI